jgi:hypothetical protein
VIEKHFHKIFVDFILSVVSYVLRRKFVRKFCCAGYKKGKVVGLVAKKRFNEAY